MKKQQEIIPFYVFPSDQVVRNSEGVIHNDTGPAVIRSNGDRFWLRNGVLDREDGPAAEMPSIGKNSWYTKGVPGAKVGKNAVFADYASGAKTSNKQPAYSIRLGMAYIGMKNVLSFIFVMLFSSRFKKGQIDDVPELNQASYFFKVRFALFLLFSSIHQTMALLGLPFTGGNFVSHEVPKENQ